MGAIRNGLAGVTDGELKRDCPSALVDDLGPGNNAAADGTGLHMVQLDMDTDRRAAREDLAGNGGDGGLLRKSQYPRRCQDRNVTRPEGDGGICLINRQHHLGR